MVDAGAFVAAIIGTAVVAVAVSAAIIIAAVVVVISVVVSSTYTDANTDRANADVDTDTIIVIGGTAIVKAVGIGFHILYLGLVNVQGFVNVAAFWGYFEINIGKNWS